MANWPNIFQMLFLVNFFNVLISGSFILFMQVFLLPGDFLTGELYYFSRFTASDSTMFVHYAIVSW